MTKTGTPVVMLGMTHLKMSFICNKNNEPNIIHHVNRLTMRVTLTQRQEATRKNGLIFHKWC